MAQAGMATGVGGLATMIYTPATLAATSGRLVEVGGAVVAPAGRYRGIESRTVFGGPISGGDGSGENAPGAPGNVYAAGDLSPEVRVGLAVTSLYGLGACYQEGWAGRYHALDGGLTSIVAQPTLAWRATPWLALGAGAHLQHVSTRTTAAIDVGAIDAGLAGGAFGGAHARTAAGSPPGSTASPPASPLARCSRPRRARGSASASARP